MLVSAIEDAIPNKLKQYQELIRRYHHSMNLMSPRAVAHLDEKIEEALSFNVAIPSKALTLLDVGSGVGLPAIPLAITLPYLSVYCVERRTKRANFLTLVVAQLGLTNVSVINMDVREVSDLRADIVTALAVGELAYLYQITKHLHSSRTTLISKKGDGWPQELSRFRETCEQSFSIETFHVKHGTLLALTF